MDIPNIKENFDKLDTYDKETLIEIIDRLLIANKRKDSKIMSLRNELKYFKRQLDKIRAQINKLIDNDAYDNKRMWSEK